MDNNISTKSIQSVQRALRIIELLSSSIVPLSAIEISGALNINRNTVHSLLNTLIAEHYVVKDTVSNKYQISEKMYSLSCTYPSKVPVVRYSDDLMKALATKYGMTLHFGVLSSTDEVLILNKYLPTSVNNIRSGFILPIHASGLGKVLLAYQPPEKIELLLSRCPFTRYTSHTITDRSELLSQLESIRENRYARDNGEYMENTYCVSFPIFNANNQILAAFSLSSQKEPLEENLERIIPDCLQSSRNLLPF